MLFVFISATIVLFVVFIYVKNILFVKSWKKNGIKVYKNNKIMGPFWEYLTKDRTMFLVLSDIYKQHPNEPAVVFGPFFQPSLYVIDPRIAEYVLQNDFHSFNHRGVEPFADDILTDNVLFQYGNKWKLVRQHMTPIFTGAKLKNMFYIMDKSAKDFVGYLHKHPEKLRGNAYDTLSTFYAAAIGASVFGITADSVFDNPFHEMALKALQPSFINNLKFSIANISMELTRLLKIKIYSEFEEFFIGAIKYVMEKRKRENTNRHDFVDLCLRLQQNETLIDRETNFEVKPTTELLAAQAFFFFLAGVEPSATTAFATLFELGRHPEHMKKLQGAIDAAFEKHNGELTYEIVNGIEELDRVMNEVLRLYPPIAFLTRQCVKDTVLPIGNIKITKGTKMFIPAYDFHHDPKYYPDPEVFNPDRFDANGNFDKDNFIPFGKGKRLCIGNRYAQIQVKTGLVHLLRNFDVVTLVGAGGIKYKKNLIQIRFENVDVEFIPRKKE